MGRHTNELAVVEQAISAHRLCTAPMMDWSDRHCRYFFRQLTRRALVYSEMITCGALLHGDIERHLRFHPAEHPVALQLGGSDPAELAHCARLASEWGYDEINLNCGCPSERVLHGSFGACLMREPELVADCVTAMREASGLPITVKHRLGIDRDEDYAFAHRFVATVSAAGCATFVVHARNAVLKGLSPKENREVPPLRYAEVYRLKRDFPKLSIVLNGGMHDWSAIDSHLQYVDGAMLGRAAYHDSYLLAQVDHRAFGATTVAPAREQVVHAMHRYADEELHRGTQLRAIARHMLGLFHGHPGARVWRRQLSDAHALARNDPQMLIVALEAMQRSPATTTA
jgi:tRNA-dihydrouridine synthase A